MNMTCCIPTLNAAADWPAFSQALKSQTLQPTEVLVIDSESTDGTPELAKRDGFRVVPIARKDFRHGATRQMALSLAPQADILLFLTQDAELAHSSSVSSLIAAFSDPIVGAAYGRQLPRRLANPIEAHARYFNYPSTSDVRGIDSVPRLGFKAIFFSNSFGAYRQSALESVDGFPLDVDFGEDTVVAGKLLLNGWKVAYSGDAQIYHSHGYSFREEFRRYLQIGKLHATHSWLLDTFGNVSGDGLRFIKSEIAWLSTRAPFLIPSALLRSCVKYVGYRRGRAMATPNEG